ncbi:threonine/serine exporter family protein [Lacicoccus alkaliphilus]|uniref:Uncharacterized membrane protein YjjB, DUF3815 family n=1 Tax=Lacicoccus alkaliphilus DSM 16010 TaxID=1123231 RepID=A0A1M7GKH8_9BACL|nr:threonine/serine exporter family protein [Salinicoccus alkaliphilus]SHM16721.1 Uncharacterized membrane protein YjjB, DUF3815 family [Salinicoccus alkaliphilus DSM 16010]
MSWLLHLIFSFTSSFFFAVLFDAPKRLFFFAGVTGATGWIVSRILLEVFNMHEVYATMFGSLVLGIMCHLMAKMLKEPATMFMVPGIIPFVPGGLAYEATSLLVQFEYNQSLNTMLEVILIAGGVAVGLLFADQLSKLIIHKNKNYADARSRKMN